MTDIEERLVQENERLRRQLSIANVRLLPEPDMPSADELVRLYGLVTHKHSCLACPLDMFERGLLATAYMRRQDKPNAAFFPTFWLDAARDFLRRQGYDNSLSLRAFTAACVVSGVVTTPLDRFPYDLEFGLVAGDVPRPYSKGWRELLVSGRLPKPTPLSRPSVYAQPQAMVQPTTDVRERPGVRIDRS